MEGGGGLGSSDAGLTMFGAGSGLGKNAGSIGASIAALRLRVSESECFPRPKPLGTAEINLNVDHITPTCTSLNSKPSTYRSRKSFAGKCSCRVCALQSAILSSPMQRRTEQLEQRGVSKHVSW